MHLIHVADYIFIHACTTFDLFIYHAGASEPKVDVSRGLTTKKCQNLWQSPKVCEIWRNCSQVMEHSFFNSLPLLELDRLDTARSCVPCLNMVRRSANVKHRPTQPFSRQPIGPETRVLFLLDVILLVILVSRVPFSWRTEGTSASTIMNYLPERSDSRNSFQITDLHQA